MSIGTLSVAPLTANAAELPVDLHESPSGKAPVQVTVGLFITNLITIDETRETFEVAGYLKAKWHDPRLVLTGSGSSEGNAALRSFKTTELWTPPIETANSVSHKTTAYLLEVDRMGDVSYVEKFDAVLSNDFNLKRFPFDTQVLQFDFQPFVSESSAIRFAPEADPSTGLSPEQHTELAAWQVKEVRYTTDKVSTTGFMPPSYEAVFQIVVKRRSGFYLWKVFLPLIMLTLIPVSVFWIDVKDIDWMLKVPMTALLSMVAFEFAIARDLPRIGYLTFMDAVFLVSFVFCFVNVAEIALVYILQKNNRREFASMLHSLGKWAYPVAYAGAICMLAICMLI